ncbi:MAG TPA: preprotein translocase subunit YajC [Rariglobus sp.]|jgi:preprotein translocase subunit YajC|nr:preprotein translocase subunit YajC [Rariglobus sp.]
MSSPIEVQSFLAQAAAPSASGGPIQLVFPILMVAAIWFLIIAPQRKKQKEHAKMLETLGAGDEVITAGGIYGEITNKKDDRFVIRISENTKIEVGKSFIQTVVKKVS